MKLIEPHIEFDFDPLEYAATIHCDKEMFEYVYSHPKSREDIDGEIRRQYEEYEDYYEHDYGGHYYDYGDNSDW